MTESVSRLKALLTWTSTFFSLSSSAVRSGMVDLRLATALAMNVAREAALDTRQAEHMNTEKE